MSHLPHRSSARAERTATPAPKALGRKQRGQSRIMMILCIGVPLIAIATLLAVGSSWLAWSTALFLLCPIVMGGMMLMMMREQRPAIKTDVAEEFISKGTSSSTESASPTANAFKA